MEHLSRRSAKSSRGSTRCDGTGCYRLCIFQGGAYPATSLQTRAKPTYRNDILEQQGDWQTQLYAQPEVAQQVPLLETTWMI